MRAKRASAMRFLLCSSVVLTASAAVIRTPLQRRLEECQLDIQDGMADDPDRVNTDGTAGIGAEFESPDFRLTKSGCSADDTNAAKRKVIAERTGTNWELTADSVNEPGALQAEYIIDGVKVKVGSTDDATNGAKVAAAMAQDLIDWYPWNGKLDADSRKVNVAENKCNKWTIITRQDRKPEKISYQPQITTPMPLEALYSLMKEQFDESDPNILNGLDRFQNKKLDFVTKNHFQSSPGGIGPEAATDDVLAFCTLVLSYAKNAKDPLQPGSSPKIFTSFTPRTNFNVMLSHVSSKLASKGDKLWDLFNILACYQSGGTEIDTDVCGGTPESPEPTDNKFGDYTFAQGDTKCNIRDWIHGLDPESDENDKLTEFDKEIDGSIGRLGKTQEKMFNSERSVPLFEFRDLNTLQTEGMEKFMGDVDQAIQDLHNKFRESPTKKARRGVCDDFEPEPEQEPEPTGPTKQLAVLGAYVPGAPTMDWLFLEADFEKGVECREDFLRPFETVPWDESGTTYPGGTKELDLEIDGEVCEYRNDGDDPGALWCGERVIGCVNDPADKDPNDVNAEKGEYQCGDYTRQPVFVCPW
ncbi:uncharacterized protein J4E87_000645 [Alternaria ethzedia]|uniref:uncharacterized protein n=1 Tax=Alternaria ethzedia TaxID=181014 RepID=UPI0020C33ECD|nr:uncharacterized protein J4E87_000645 [Alternaria ethzedia]KAI4635690.1 hypothetical protein J4E87_000645 [Alternaria ethzedia]